MVVPEEPADDVPAPPEKRPRCAADAPEPAPAAGAGGPSQSAPSSAAAEAAPAEGRDPASGTPSNGSGGKLAPPAAADKPSQQNLEPPPYASGGYIAAGDGWWAHSGGQWLYNVEEKTYFHLPTGQLRLALDEGTVPMSLGTAGEGEAGSNGAGTPAAADAGEAAAAALGGKIKWFNPFKGFGFLEPLHEGADHEDIFFHKNQLLGDNIDLQGLKPGASVTYSVGETDDGRKCAVRVKVASAAEKGGDKKGQDAQAAGEDEKEEAEEAADGEGGEEEEDGDGSSSAESVDIDLFEELHSGMYQAKGDAKDVCEDFAVDKVKIPVSVLGETATCVFFGVFDGHGGAYCAEYAATHIAKNVLSRLRDRTKTANDETALKTALMGGFRQTEHNFLQHAKRVGDSSGTTACTMTVFGPDEEMRLRLYLANAGDSRAVLGRASGGFLRLTEDHKPNLPAEKKHIEKEGGSVVEVMGCWRAILPQKRRTAGIIGLAVSRALGDKDFKGPNIVNPDPDITIHEVDWDDDEFVILATDGIWDVVSDKEAVRLVQRSLHQFGNEEKAAEELVRKARDRGSKDDCTALIVRFGWLKKKEGEGVDDGNASEPDEEMEAAEAEGEKAGLAQQKAPEAEGGTQAAEEDEDEEAEEDDEEEEEEEEEGAAVGPASAAGPACAAPGATASAAGDSDSEDDIFAARPEDKGRGAAEPLPQIPTPAADTSGLFDGLGPTLEELPGFLGPSRPAGVTALGGKGGEGTDGVAKEEAVPSGPPPAVVDDDLDMFGS